MRILQERQMLTNAFNNYIDPSTNQSIQQDDLNESYLRMEFALGTQSNFSFNPLETTKDSATPKTSRLLKPNNAFIITHLGFALLQEVAAEDTDAARLLAHSRARLHHFYNPAVFGGTNDPNLQGIYNGFMTVDVNQTEWFSGIDMTRFERVGSAQQGLLTACYVQADGTTDVESFYGASTKDDGLYGYYPVTPWWISGTDTAQFTVNLPTSLNLAATGSNTTNYAVLLVRGYQINNGNKFVYNK